MYKSDGDTCIYIPLKTRTNLAGRFWSDGPRTMGNRSRGRVWLDLHHRRASFSFSSTSIPFPRRTVFLYALTLTPSHIGMSQVTRKHPTDSAYILPAIRVHFQPAAGSYDGAAAHMEPTKLSLLFPVSAADLHPDATLPFQCTVRVIPSRVRFKPSFRVRRPLLYPPVGRFPRRTP